ncbi:MAG: hypothetical protein C0506_03245 [Anaerolinea sp.]|nr:hypothetical protein [Anaerolinea sp.]
MSTEARSEIQAIESRLRALSPAARALVAEFVEELERQDTLRAGATAIASEQALARDWLAAAEDEAWSGL